MSKIDVGNVCLGPNEWHQKSLVAVGTAVSNTALLSAGVYAWAEASGLQ